MTTSKQKTFAFPTSKAAWNFMRACDSDGVMAGCPARSTPTSPWKVLVLVSARTSPLADALASRFGHQIEVAWSPTHIMVNCSAHPVAHPAYFFVPRAGGKEHGPLMDCTVQEAVDTTKAAFGWTAWTC